MKLIAKLTGILFLIVAFSCSTDIEQIKIKEGSPPQIASTLTNNAAIVLDSKNSDKIALAITWTATQYLNPETQGSVLGKYTIEISTDEQFTAPHIENVGDVLAYSITHKKLNSILLGLGLEAEVAASVYIRVKSIFFETKVLNSPDLTFSISPYSIVIPPLIAVPDALFLVGDARGTWDLPLPKFTKESETVFTLDIYLSGSKPYELITDKDGKNWTPVYRLAPNANPQNLIYGGTFVQDGEGSEYDWKSIKIISPPNAGTYRLRFDFQKATFTVSEPIKKKEGTPPQIASTLKNNAAIELNSKNPDDIALAITWAAAQYLNTETQGSGEYAIEISTDEQFTAPHIENVGNVLAYSITNKKFNSILLGLKLKAGVATKVYIRVKSIFSKTEGLYSTHLTFLISPYSITVSEPTEKKKETLPQITSSTPKNNAAIELNSKNPDDIALAITWAAAQHLNTATQGSVSGKYAIEISTDEQFTAPHIEDVGNVLTYSITNKKLNSILLGLKLKAGVATSVYIRVKSIFSKTEVLYSPHLTFLISPYSIIVSKPTEKKKETLPQITSSTPKNNAPIELKSKNPDDIALAITWAAAQHLNTATQGSVSGKYTIEISNDEQFTAPHIEGVGNVLAYSITNKKLNSILLGLKLKTGVAAPVYIRVKSIFSKTEVLYSTHLTFLISPYSIIVSKPTEKKKETPPKITSSTPKNNAAIELKSKNPDDIALAITWAAAQHLNTATQGSVSGKYTIEISTDEQFTAPHIEGVGNVLTYSITNKKLNSILLGLKLKAGVATKVYIRVKSIFSKTEVLYSPHLTFLISPYSIIIPPLIAVPDALYLVGGARKVVGFPLPEFTKKSETVFTLDIDLYGNSDYELITDKDGKNWTPVYRLAPNANRQNLIYGGTFVQDGKGSKHNWKSKRILSPPGTGTYRLKFDFQTATFTVSAAP